MFKKIVISLMVVFGLNLGSTIFNSNLVLPYPTHALAQSQTLNGDRNYPLLFSKTGISVYLDCSSVVVLNENIRQKAFAQNIVITNSDGEITEVKTIWYILENGTTYYSKDNETYTAFDPFDQVEYLTSITRGFRWGFPIAFGYQFP